MKNPELGLSFRSEPRSLDVVKYTATRYGMETDFIGVYDDLGDMPLVHPLYEAAINLPAASSTRLGAVGFAVPKLSTMVDTVGHASALAQTMRDPSRVVLGLVPGAWMERVGLREANVRQMREAVDATKYLLRHETGGYEGTYQNTQPGFELNYETDPNIPVLLGAWGERMAALAGEAADEIKVGGSANPAMVPIMRERIAAGANRIGRDPNEIGIVLGAVTIVDRDGGRAREAAKHSAVTYIEAIGHKDPTAQDDFAEEIAAIQAAVRRGDTEEAVSRLPNELMDRFIIAGTPTDIIRHTEQMIAAGASRVEFGTPHGIGDSAGDEIQGVDLLVKEVFPYFKQG